MTTQEHFEPTADHEFREVFAHVGSALMYFQLIELHLASLVAFCDLEHPVSYETYGSREAAAQRRTYNQLVAQYGDSPFVIPELLHSLRGYGDFRNSLAHRYMIESIAPFLSSSESRVQLCEELKATTDELQRLLSAVVAQRTRLCQKHGLAPRDTKEVATAILTGTANVFRRRIAVGSKVVVISAYLLQTPTGAVPLLETAEGAILYLASDGLQIFGGDGSDSDLRPYELLNRLLPSAVVRRPKRDGPWHYDINIHDHAIQVRPLNSQNFEWQLVKRK